MTPTQLTALFGGQTATARILGLKSARHVRRVCAGTAPMPDWWVDKLKTEARKRAIELSAFADGDVL